LTHRVDNLLERDARGAEASHPRFDEDDVAKVHLPAILEVQAGENDRSHRAAEPRLEEIETTELGVRGETGVVHVAERVGVAEADLDVGAVPEHSIPRTGENTDETPDNIRLVRDGVPSETQRVTTRHAVSGLSDGVRQSSAFVSHARISIELARWLD